MFQKLLSQFLQVGSAI